ncbi:MAG: hypothetical protein JWO69_874 [Thermoleophilia bacterium]|jgi:hypothetical protein|nr:hypothetical protein [Thermoleophilia bacterium]
MHDATTRRSDIAPDLATLVIADARARGDDGSRSSGHDPRSVLVLAIVVGTLAMVIAWTATLGGNDQLAPLERTAPTEAQKARGAAVPLGPATPKAAPAVDGIDLAIGRVTTSVGDDGMSVVRVAVRNAGSTAAPRGGELLVLLDGAAVGRTTVGALAARGGAVISQVPLYRCVTGRHALVVVADGSGGVAEGDEGNNARSLNARFSCG